MRREVASSTLTVAVLTLSLTAIASKSAHAYIDPGTGSYVLQAVIASLLAAAFVIKSTWRNIKQAFVKRFARRPEDAE